MERTPVGRATRALQNGMDPPPTRGRGRGTPSTVQVALARRMLDLNVAPPISTPPDGRSLSVKVEASTRNSDQQQQSNGEVPSTTTPVATPAAAAAPVAPRAAAALRTVRSEEFKGYPDSPAATAATSTEPTPTPGPSNPAAVVAALTAIANGDTPAPEPPIGAQSDSELPAVSIETPLSELTESSIQSGDQRDAASETSIDNEQQPIVNSRLIRPVAALKTAVPAPVQAPAPQHDGMIEYWRDGGKLGNASVHPTQVEPIIPKGVEGDVQDIIKHTYNILLGRGDRVNLGVREVTLHGIVALPYRHGAAPMIRVSRTFPRTFARKRPLTETKLVWEQPVATGILNPVVLRSFLLDGRIDSRYVGSIMRGDVNMSNAFSQAAAPLLQSGHHCYDVSSMFTALFLLIDYSIFIDRVGLQRVRGEPRGGVITTVDVSADGVNALPQIATATEAIEAGRICIRRSDISSADISVLTAVSTGPGYIVVDAGDQPFIHSRITWPAINWTLWSAAAVALPDPAVVTTAQLIVTAEKLARLLRAEPDYVAGYVRAQTIINCTLITGDNQTDTHCTSGLEIERIHMPIPRGRHFIWDMITDDYVLSRDPTSLSEEYQVLHAMPTAMLVLTGTVVASIYSVAVSSVLTQVNIGGKLLNDWAQAVPSPATSFLKRMLDVRPNQGTTMINSIACNVVTQFTGMKLSWLCFQTQSFCGGFNHRHDLPRNSAWEQRWQLHVPYLLRPESLEWIIEKWLSVWGVSGPLPSYDISNEMFSSGLPANQVMAIWLGDDKYREAALCSTPYMYNPYGLYMINMVKQNWRNDEAYPIYYRLVTRSVGNTVMVDPEYRPDDLWQPVYDGATFSIVAGSLLSFNWDLMAIMAPNIMRANLGNFWEALLHDTKSEHCAAGFLSRRDPAKTAFTIAGYDFDQVFLGASKAKPEAAAPAEAPANKEN